MAAAGCQHRPVLIEKPFTFNQWNCQHRKVLEYFRQAVVAKRRKNFSLWGNFYFSAT
nr:unnamed protein product [Callosobruchus analis]